jgi:hypothetical protein
MPFAVVTPIYDPKMRGLCARPYEGHKHGCPNFSAKHGCPPGAPLLPEAYDLAQPCYVIWSVFPFGDHVAEMKRRHPDWSERQAACCLYWQGKARKALEKEISTFRRTLNTNDTCYNIERCPEAMGLNVTETMRQVNIELEWPPAKHAVHVAFAGRTKA